MHPRPSSSATLTWRPYIDDRPLAPAPEPCTDDEDARMKSFARKDGTVVVDCHRATTTFHHRQQPPVVVCDGADQAVRITASGSKLARGASYREEAFQTGFARTTNRTLFLALCVTLFYNTLSTHRSKFKSAAVCFSASPNSSGRMHTRPHQRTSGLQRNLVGARGEPPHVPRRVHPDAYIRSLLRMTRDRRASLLPLFLYSR